MNKPQSFSSSNSSPPLPFPSSSHQTWTSPGGRRIGGWRKSEEEEVVEVEVDEVDDESEAADADAAAVELYSRRRLCVGGAIDGDANVAWRECDVVACQPESARRESREARSGRGIDANDEGGTTAAKTPTPPHAVVFILATAAAAPFAALAADELSTMTIQAARQSMRQSPIGAKERR